MKSTHVRIGENAYLDTFSCEFIFVKEGNNERVRIEPLVARLMASIAVNADSLVSREELVKEVWEGNEGVGNKALTRNIYKIRKVFEAQGLENPIETIPKRGYRLRAWERSTELKGHLKSKWVIAAAVLLLLLVFRVDVPGLLHNLAASLGH